MKKQEYVNVPVEWLNGLFHLSDRAGEILADRSKIERANLLIGYCSSAKTIIKYNLVDKEDVGSNPTVEETL